MWPWKSLTASAHLAPVYNSCKYYSHTKFSYTSKMRLTCVKKKKSMLYFLIRSYVFFMCCGFFKVLNATNPYSVVQS